MKRTVILFVVIAISMVMSVSSEADEKGFAPREREKRLALVIGNADYKTAPLKNTINDANDMEKALRKLGFDVIARLNAGQKDMEEIIREFGAKLRKHDVGLFYYSGHGVQANGENYLIPTDAEIRKESDLKYAAVHAGKVLDEMTDAGNRLNIVILDACRDNSLPKSFRSARQGLAQMDAPSGMLIAYATSPNSTASDGSRRNGTYTENLLKHMTVPGLPIEKLFKEVRKGVLQDSGNKQRPWESVSITDDFYFVADSGSVATEKPEPVVKPSVSQKTDQPVQPVQKPKYKLRSEPITISESEFERIFKLDENKRSTEYVQNDFKGNDDDTIFDHATGLMWQKSGSDNSIYYKDIPAYIEELNHKKFGGHSDWRLPTVDELKSLLTSEKQSNNLYINPIFDKKQWWCWTSDQRESGGAWYVVFNVGKVYWQNPKNEHYVRAVRSLQ